MNSFVPLCILISILAAFPLKDISAADPELGIEVEGDLPLCPGDSAILSVTSAEEPDSVLWTGGPSIANDTARSTAVHPLQTSIYTLTAFYPDTSCSVNMQIDVTPAMVDVQEGDTLYLCLGESGQLTLEVDANPGFTVAWTPEDYLSSPNGTVTEVSPPDTSIHYTVTLTTPEGCTWQDSIFVRFDSIPRDFEISNIPGPRDPCMKYCPGDVVALFTQPADEEKYPDITYEWLPNVGYQDSTWYQNVPIVTSFTTEYIRVASNGGCEERDSILIEVVDPSIPTSINDTTVCPGMSVDVFIDPTDLMEIEWGPEEYHQFMSCTDCPNPRITIGEIGDVINGNFTFTVTAEKEECCPASGSVRINIVTEVIPVDDVVVCAGQSGQINVTDPRVEVIQWDDPNGNLSCTDCPNPIATVADTTTFTFRGLDANDCTLVGSATVFVEPPREIIANPVITCVDDPVQINVTDPSLVDIDWNDPSGYLSCEDCFNPLATVPSPQVFGFSATDMDGCFVIGSAIVNIYPDPDTLSITASGTSVAVGGTVTVTVSIFPEPDDPVVEWTVNGNPSQEIGLEAELLIPAEGENVIVATVTDVNGCERVLQISIEGVAPIYEVPRAFTPNGDRINDYFRPVIVNADMFEGDFISDFKIFNRWGEKVYENDDNEQGWDGRQEGELAPSDVYVYLITVTLPDGSTQNFKGDVTLLR